jgi:hypothetical protein
MATRAFYRLIFGLGRRTLSGHYESVAAGTVDRLRVFLSFWVLLLEASSASAGLFSFQRERS